MQVIVERKKCDDKNKRQINGSHHHVSKRHLPKYLEEHDYKYNARDKSDGARTVAAIKNMEEKRLTLFKPEGSSSWKAQKSR